MSFEEDEGVGDKQDPIPVDDMNQEFKWQDNASFKWKKISDFIFNQVILKVSS